MSGHSLSFLRQASFASVDHVSFSQGLHWAVCLLTFGVCARTSRCVFTNDVNGHKFISQSTDGELCCDIAQNQLRRHNYSLFLKSLQLGHLLDN